jgi:GH25 family lysozyme M1 (1,4-beta-N-acetylmuramidase)
MRKLRTVLRPGSARATTLMARLVASAVASMLVACTGAVDTSEVEQLARVCAAGPTTKGIDVSYYQGTIDWAKVKAAGVAFAFVRVSDGLANIDSKFSQNWSGTRAAGVIRGAYQFFRPNLDAAAQANLFVQKVGKLAADDLPPVIDVEATGSQSAAVIAAKVRIWIDIVEAATGKKPIIYTGYYFWRDSVGDAKFPGYPLWIAAYVNHCPDLPSGWDTWSFWQTSSTGQIAGIAGAVDINSFNGDRAGLLAMTGVAATCGDNKCEGSETTETCAVDCPPCGVVAAAGGTIDDGDACFEGGGNPMFLRSVTDAGAEGDLLWTYATNAAAEGNFAQWNLYLAEAGRYSVEVYTDATYGKSKKASYRISASGAADVSVAIDQTAVNGWQALGEFEFAAGGRQFVHVGDNTGEPSVDKVQLALDSVRLTRLDLPVDPIPPPASDEGCNAGRASAATQLGASGGLLLALVAIGWPRRRRRRR